jgi:hypothetical protein
LQQKGIEVISSTLENALGSDLPFIDQAAFRPFTPKNTLYMIWGVMPVALYCFANLKDGFKNQSIYCCV